MGESQQKLASPIDILCRVVDNHGDIGVVWRLAKSLRLYSPSSEIRIIVDDLTAFAAMQPGLDPIKTSQSLSSFIVVHESDPGDFPFSVPAVLCIEAFACGRAPWYERILFDPTNGQTRVHVIFEYLSAESYPAEFHLMPSLSPIPQVKKIFFMPGFSTGTGGLIRDEGFITARTEWNSYRKIQAGRKQNATSPAMAQRRSESLKIWQLPDDTECAAFWICIFSYEHDFRPFIRDIAAWSNARTGPVTVLVAGSRASGDFLRAWNEAERPFPAVPVPFMSQENWDSLMLASDFCVVRGEESLSRAVLSGRPFLWHAYLQEDGYQRVKVAALLDLMEKELADKLETNSVQRAWFDWRTLMETFNERTINSAERPATEKYLSTLQDFSILEPVFQSFSSRVEALGDCAAGLLSLYREMG